MSSSVRRLRMFAGPNGSGKSTLVRSLAKECCESGHFRMHRWINADEIEAALRRGPIDLTAMAPNASAADWEIFARRSSRMTNYGAVLDVLDTSRSILMVHPALCDSYLAATIADYLRACLIESGESFAFETVLSHPAKLEELALARRNGYRTYLYYVATDSPRLNELRIAQRVKQGEHAVPRDKLIERYSRSLALLAEAVDSVDRAYLFDNSEEHPIWFAEKLPDGRLVSRAESDWTPRWFRQLATPLRLDSP